MPSLGRMCYLTTVVGTFHGRVLAARLGAEGVVVVLKGAAEGPYPLQSAVDVLVPADQLALAREILLADAVDDAFSGLELGEGAEEDEAGPSIGAREAGDVPDGHGRSSRRRVLPTVLVLVVVAMMLAAACVAAVVY